MLIRRAFTTLLRQKPIQSISVKELCELAEINRGTFYAHYTDIYDLRDQIEQEMQTDFAKALEPLLSLDDSQLTPIQVTAGIFQCLADNSDLCVVTLGDYGDKAFAMRLLNMGREKCMESYTRYFEGVSPSKVEYYYAFVSSGCIGLLQKWLADGMVVPAEEIARMAEELMLRSVGFLRDDRVRGK
ncbi:MAG: TetR/AcrR family transcriptional regulator [Clostridiales bacterium]|nr:TetR/AcrR family transcriptional regulator [Clostridiales bacterium]